MILLMQQFDSFNDLIKARINWSMEFPHHFSFKIEEWNPRDHYINAIITWMIMLF